MKTINIEDIMKEIREEINKKNYPGNIIKFEDVELDKNSIEMLELDTIKFNQDSFKSSIVYLKNNKEVSAWRYFEPNGLISKLKIFIKKVIRKMTKFYIEPIVNDQNNLNEKIYEALCQINAKQLSDEQKILELNNKIKKLEKELMEKEKCE